MRPAPAFARRSRAIVLAALVAVATGAMTSASAVPSAEGPLAARAGRAPATALALAAPSPDLPGLPPVSPDLAEIAVESPALRRARGRYDDVAATLAAEQGRRVGIDLALADMARQQAQVRASLAAARARAAGATSRLRAVEGAIGALAVSLYTTGGPTARVEAALATEQPSIHDADRRDVLGSASLDVLLAERAAYKTRRDEALARTETARFQADELAQQRLLLIAQRPATEAAEVAAAERVATMRVTHEQARALATVEGVEFPLVALDAYYRAAETSADEDPACGVRWWAIAGISRVEGRHGTYGGAALDEFGDATQRIIGIPLDGTNETQIVGDSDGGALDGDPVFDRAVGPMQFIPQTWGRFAADGNDDGLVTPFNLYDATLAASRYLCLASGALETEPGLRAAYFAYNHSEAYVESVLSFARHYERSVDLPDPRD